MKVIWYGPISHSLGTYYTSGFHELCLRWKYLDGILLIWHLLHWIMVGIGPTYTCGLFLLLDHLERIRMHGIIS